jgi:hypothetical protein
MGGGSLRRGPEARGRASRQQGLLSVTGARGKARGRRRAAGRASGVEGVRRGSRAADLLARLWPTRAPNRPIPPRRPRARATRRAATTARARTPTASRWTTATARCCCCGRWRRRTPTRRRRSRARAGCSRRAAAPSCDAAGARPGGRGGRGGRGDGGDSGARAGARRGGPGSLLALCALRPNLGICIAAAAGGCARIHAPSRMIPLDAGGLCLVSGRYWRSICQCLCGCGSIMCRGCVRETTTHVRTYRTQSSRGLANVACRLGGCSGHAQALQHLHPQRMRIGAATRPGWAARPLVNIIPFKRSHTRITRPVNVAIWFHGSARGLLTHEVRR